VPDNQQVNPASITVLRDLTGLYGDAFTATLVVVLFCLLVRAQREHLRDVRTFGEAAVQLRTTVEANTRTIQSAAETLDDASDTLRLAFELTGKSKRRRNEVPPSTGEVSR
jgi:hypothetical protein